MKGRNACAEASRGTAKLRREYAAEQDVRLNVKVFPDGFAAILKPFRQNLPAETLRKKNE